MLNGGIMIELC